jgi:hypothetical protein
MRLKLMKLKSINNNDESDCSNKENHLSKQVHLWQKKVEVKLNFVVKIKPEISVQSHLKLLSTLEIQINLCIHRPSEPAINCYGGRSNW